MIATVTRQRPPFIYGEILSRSLCEEGDARSKGPGIFTFVTQGAATGAILAFLFTAFHLFWAPAYYNFLLVGALPKFLCVGLGTGAIKGLVIWACAKLTRHRLIWFFRSLIAIALLEGMQRAYDYFVPPPIEPPPDQLAWWVGTTVF